MKDYSQHGEQAHILHFFNDQPEGKFLDIGAYDGITFSNTRALLEKPGWSGTAVEPSPICMSNLIKNLDGMRDRITRINALVLPQLDPDKKLYDFWDSNGDAVSTNKESHKKIWEKDVPFTHLLMPAITIHDIKNLSGDVFDFINVDVEGGSMDLFEQLCDFFTFKLICVEHDGELERIARIADFYELDLVHRNGVNHIYSL